MSISFKLPFYLFKGLYQMAQECCHWNIVTVSTETLFLPNILTIFVDGHPLILPWISLVDSQTHQNYELL